MNRASENSQWPVYLERLYGEPTSEGDVGFVALKGKTIDTVGQISSTFDGGIDGLIERISPDVDALVLIGKGSESQLLTEKLRDDLQFGPYESLHLREALLHVGEEWRSLVDGQTGQVDLQTNLEWLPESLKASPTTDIMERFLPHDIDRSNALTEQARAHVSVEKSQKNASPYQQARFLKELLVMCESQDIKSEGFRKIAGGVDSGAMLVELSRFPYLQSVMIEHAVSSPRIAGVLVEAARRAPADEYCDPIWEAALTSVWMSGTDGNGPVPSHVVAQVAGPLAERSERLRSVAFLAAVGASATPQVERLASFTAAGLALSQNGWEQKRASVNLSPHLGSPSSPSLGHSPTL